MERQPLELIKEIVICLKSATLSENRHPLVGHTLGAFNSVFSHTVDEGRAGNTEHFGRLKLIPVLPS